MSDVIGPNSYLPGDVMQRLIPDGTMCNTHSDRRAVAELVGETDSMGSETYYACKECVDESRNAPAPVGKCDWCKTDKVELKQKRDYEEGSNGRVYDVCHPCSDRYEKRVAAEMEADRLYYGSNDDYLEPEPEEEEIPINPNAWRR